MDMTSQIITAMLEARDAIICLAGLLIIAQSIWLWVSHWKIKQLIKSLEIRHHGILERIIATNSEMKKITSNFTPVGNEDKTQIKKKHKEET